MKNFCKSFEKDIRSMVIIVPMVGEMSTFTKEIDYVKDKYQRKINAIKIISKIPKKAALVFRILRELHIVYPIKIWVYTEFFM